MLYAALGDSITYGYSATSEDRKYVSRIRRALGRPGRVSLYVCAKPGWTSRQLRRAVLKTPECIWDEARLVTILVGGNDLIWSAPWLVENNPARMMKVAERLYENLNDMVECVARPRSTILLATLYNPFPNSLLSEEYTTELNQSIRRVARRRGLRLVDLHGPFLHREEKLIDGYSRGQIKDFKIRNNPVHPNDTGHRVIARSMLAAWRRDASKPRTGAPGRTGRATRRT